MTQSEKHIDEIKNLREEINWRVKISYTSNVLFLIIISFVSNYVSEPNIFKLRETQISFIGLISVILISMYSSILNGNHLIEKRIELYILHLQKKLFELDNFPHHFWISYLYGYRFKKHKFIRFLSIISSTTVGLFQYAFPIILSMFLLIYLNVNYNAFKTYPFLYIIALIIFLISFLSGLFFLIFVSKLSKEHTIFFNDIVLPYMSSKNKNI